MEAIRFFAPQVIAYGFTSPAIASCADSLISRGAGKSGNPCARLTAPYCIAWRVISRITDSVKCATLLLRNDFDRVRVSDMEVRVTGSAQAWPSRTSTACCGRGCAHVKI